MSFECNVVLFVVFNAMLFEFSFYCSVRLVMIVYYIKFITNSINYFNVLNVKDYKQLYSKLFPVFFFLD